MLGAATACRDEPTAPDGSAAPAAVQRVVDSVAAAAGLPGVVVGVERADGSLYFATTGVADRASRRRVRPEDHFRVASLTKPMVAIVVLQLVAEGRLALDDPLARHLPGVVPDADRITLRQLLNHTSGVGDYRWDPAFQGAVLANPSRPWSAADLLAVVGRQPPTFAPGAPSRWAYSNSNYVLLGRVVETVTGRSVGQELQARVFDPLELRHTYYAVETSLRSPFAEGYADLTPTLRDVAVGTLLHPSTAGAAGAVVSTAPDLLRVGRALASGELLAPALHAAQREGVAASAFTFPGDAIEVRYGLGLAVGGAWVGHNGAMPGYGSMLFARPGGDAVVVLTNESEGTGAVEQIAVRVRRLEFGGS